MEYETVTVCGDCESFIIKYGAPDRSCDKHWEEDHPGGISVTFQLVDVNRDALRLFFGEGSTP